MKAVMFHGPRAGLEIVDEPDPVAAIGEAVVDVAAAPVLPYHDEVLSGARPMLFEPPFIPRTGSIGRIRALGAGATVFKPGDWVYCDPTLRARDGQGRAHIALHGLTAGGASALPILRQFRHGSWAQQVRVPIETLTLLGAVEPASAPQWLTLAAMLVPYGGLLAVALQPGETVVVSGATGSFGSAGVAVALAMGAARVVATGRNGSALTELARRHGSRVRGVVMSGEREADTAAIAGAAEAPVDVVLDILPPAASAQQVMAALLSVRPGGRVALMGGVGTSGAGELPLPYSWLMRNDVTLRGQWMYPRSAVPRLIALARSGLIDLGGYDITQFPLMNVREAVAHAAATSGPFSRTVLIP